MRFPSAAHSNQVSPEAAIQSTRTSALTQCIPFIIEIITHGQMPNQFSMQHHAHHQTASAHTHISRSQLCGDMIYWHRRQSERLLLTLTRTPASALGLSLGSAATIQCLVVAELTSSAQYTGKFLFYIDLADSWTDRPS